MTIVTILISILYYFVRLFLTQNIMRAAYFIRFHRRSGSCAVWCSDCTPGLIQQSTPRATGKYLVLRMQILSYAVVGLPRIRPVGAWTARAAAGAATALPVTTCSCVGAGWRRGVSPGPLATALFPPPPRPCSGFLFGAVGSSSGILAVFIADTNMS